MENNSLGTSQLIGILVLSKMLWNYVFALEDSKMLKQKDYNYLVNKMRDVKNATEKVTRPAEVKLKQVGLLQPLEESIFGYHHATDLIFQLNSAGLKRVITLANKILKEQENQTPDQLIQTELKNQ